MKLRLKREKTPSAAQIEMDAETLAERSNITSVNGKQFVSGLFWQQLSNPNGFMKEARAIGTKNGWDVVAIRRGLRIQAGFVSKKIGAIKGMYSLAAALAGQLGPFWLGAFELEDGRYAVVGVKDNSIIPGFDLICDREEALAKLHEGASLMGFSDDSMYAPVDFNFSQHERKLADLLQPKRLKAEYRLKQLKFGLTTKEIVRYSLVGVLAVAGLFSFTQYQAYEKKKLFEQQVREAAQRAAELQRLNENTKKAQTVKALDHPWAKLPAAAVFAKACASVIESIPLSVGGWTFDAATCDDNGVEITYKRTTAGTTVKTFLEEADGLFVAAPKFKDEAKTVVVMRRWEAEFAGDEPLEVGGAIITDVTAYFQTLDIPVRFEDRPVAVPPAPAPVPGEVAVPAPVPDWKEIVFSFKSGLSPAEFSELLGRHTGVRVREIKVELKDEAALDWNIKGEIYAKI